MRNVLGVGVLLAAMALLAGRPAVAQTFQEALVEAYEGNPTLNAERARLRATDEQVPQALSGYRPTVTTNIQAGRTWIGSNQEAITGQQDDSLFERRYGASIEQPLYRGGQTVAAVRSAENTVRSERARLELIEQTVMLDAVTAYSDVYRDQAVLELTISNEQRLNRQLEATRDRFQVGEVTRTDVSQAEARLSRAVADRIRAEGDLARSRAVFRNVIGRMPSALPQPPLPDGLPANLEDANKIALDWNPDVTAAAFQERSALDSVDQVKGELLPTVSLIGRVQRDVDVSRKDSRFDTAEAIINLEVPLYQSGRRLFAPARAQAAGDRTAATARSVAERRGRGGDPSLERAGNGDCGDPAHCRSRCRRISWRWKASRRRRRWVRAPSSTCSMRSRNCSTSQVTLARSQRDEVVAAYQLKSSVGQLTARRLELPVANYEPIAGAALSRSA